LIQNLAAFCGRVGESIHPHAFRPSPNGKTWVKRTTATPTWILKNTRFYGEKWCAQGDDFRTFLNDFVGNLAQVDDLLP